MFTENSHDRIIGAFDRLIQRCSLPISTSIDISAVGNQDLSGSFVRQRIAFALGRTAHRDSVKGGRSNDGVLIDIGTAFQQ